MSRLTTLATIIPGEAITVATPNTGMSGSVDRLNKMIGSASQLAALVNGAGLDASNFRENAGISRLQKAQGWAPYALTFGIPNGAPGLFGAININGSTVNGITLLQWEPRPGTATAFADSGNSVYLNYNISADSAGHTLYVFKQTQNGPMVQLLAQALTIDGADHNLAVALTIPAGESRQIRPEKGTKVLVILENAGGGGTQIYRLDGALLLQHAHTRWND